GPYGTMGGEGQPRIKSNDRARKYFLPSDLGDSDEGCRCQGYCARGPRPIALSQVDWGIPVGAGLRRIPGPFCFSVRREHLQPPTQDLPNRALAQLPADDFPSPVRLLGI